MFMFIRRNLVVASTALAGLMSVAFLPATSPAEAADASYCHAQFRSCLARFSHRTCDIRYNNCMAYSVAPTTSIYIGGFPRGRRHHKDDPKTPPKTGGGNGGGGVKVLGTGTYSTGGVKVLGTGTYGTGGGKGGGGGSGSGTSAGGGGGGKPQQQQFSFRSSGGGFGGGRSGGRR
jgi:hypothetical protein